MVGAALLAVPSCGQSRLTPRSGGDEAGAPSAPGGNSGEGGAASDGASGATFALTLDVLHSTPERRWVPAEGAHVLAESARVSVETRSDSRGHASLVVDSDDGPWDVTVALEGHSVASILNVTGPISTPVHLGDNRVLESERHLLTASFSGVGPAASSIQLQVGGLIVSASPESSVTASFIDYPGAPPLRVLASEWGTDEPATPRNAIWLDVPRTGEDITLEVSLPDPPRSVREARMTLRPPMSGAVVATGMTGTPGSAIRQEDGQSWRVGASWLAPETNGEESRDWHVVSFEGDMEPTFASIRLENEVNGDTVFARAPVADDALIEVAPAEELDARGATLDTLSLRWSAPEHTHVGASLISSPGAWYIYGAAEDVTVRAWPRLPRDVSLADVGFTEDQELRVNVFATTQPDEKDPWNWSNSTISVRWFEREACRAVEVRGARAEVEAVKTGAPGATPARTAAFQAGEAAVVAETEAVGTRVAGTVVVGTVAWEVEVACARGRWRLLHPRR